MATRKAALRGEYDRRLASMIEVLQTHITEDANNFKELTTQVLEVNKDVKSLLNSRSFLRGAWFAVATVGTLVGVIVGLVMAWYK